MRKTKISEETIGTKTYILDLKSGRIRKVTVPANWKLTFGLTAPYSNKGAAYNEGLALRFYEGTKDNLRMVFTDVKAFRDASITIAERITQTQRKVVQRHEKGGSKDVVVEARVTEWMNPDEADSEAEKPNPFLLALQDGELSK